jgi:hypothetical protein
MCMGLCSVTILGEWAFLFSFFIFQKIFFAEGVLPPVGNPVVCIVSNPRKGSLPLTRSAPQLNPAGSDFGGGTLAGENTHHKKNSTSRLTSCN